MVTEKMDAPKKRVRRGAAPAKKTPAPDKAPTYGRDSVLSISRCKAIVGAIQLGNYITTACEYAGIGRSTYHEWVNRGAVELDRVHSLPRKNLEKIMESFEGEDPNEVDDNTGRPLDKGTVEYMWRHRPREFHAVEWPYVIFKHLTDRARASAEVRHVSNITKAAQSGHWQASAWWLERTNHEKYGRKDQVTHSGTPGGQPIQTQTVVTVNQLNERLDELLKRNPVKDDA